MLKRKRPQVVRSGAHLSVQDGGWIYDVVESRI